MALLNFKLYTFVRIFHLKYKENNLPRGLGKINDEIIDLVYFKSRMFDFVCRTIPGLSITFQIRSGTAPG